MNALDLVNLTPLMERTSGRAQVKIGLIDGPVSSQHPALRKNQLHEVPSNNSGACTQANSMACLHGTFVAGILCAKRNSSAPAICPDCTLLVRPVFTETASGNEHIPRATPEALAGAIIECVATGARVINLSLALAPPSATGERELEQALDYAARHGALVVAAAGNQGTVGSSAITRHPWVIPVVAYGRRRRPMSQSNFARSIGSRGLGAPGENVTSLGSMGESLTLTGSSVAAPFVTGAIALLWSEFPTALASTVKFAMTRAYAPARTSVVPPLLDAWNAYQFLVTAQTRR